MCVFDLLYTGARRVNYLPRSGCNLPCICDTDNNFIGFDSCKCEKFKGKCPNGEKLGLNGSCLPERQDIHKFY